MEINRPDIPKPPSFSQDPGKSEPDSSRFIRESVAALLERFSISFIREGNRIEYFITDRESKNEVSFSLVFCHDIFANHLHVSKFYPGLFRQPHNQYLSAACFFLLTTHCAALFNLGPDQSIFLQCRKKVFEEFYARLNDFNFVMTRTGQGDNVDVRCPCPALTDLDTTMIIERKALSL